MYQLSLSNIDHIRSDISRQRVRYSHLLDDLVDHVCCDVENEMNSGLPFDKAYSKVKSRVGPNRFKKIQEETLLLIDKNYKNMKTFLKIFGALSPSLIALAALFKIQHWPGASIMLTLGFFFLCFFFLPSAVYVLYTENQSGKKHLFMHITGLFSSIFILLGFLFKVMHWPGAAIMITVGMVLAALTFLPSLVFSRISEDKGEGKKTAYIVGLFAGLFYITGFLFKLMHWPGASMAILISMILAVGVFLPAYSYAHFKNEEHIKGRFVFLIVTVMMAVLSLSLMSLTVSKNVFAEFVAVENHMDQIHNELSSKNEKLVKTIENEHLAYQYASDIHSKTAEIDTWITELKKELLLTSHSENSKAISGNNIDCSRIINKDETNVPSEILMGEERNGKAFELAKKMQVHKDYLLSVSQDRQLDASLNLLIDVTGKTTINESSYSWEELQFGHRTLISVLNSLTTIQIKLRLAEKEVIQSLSLNENLALENMIALDLSTK